MLPCPLISIELVKSQQLVQQANTSLTGKASFHGGRLAQYYCAWKEKGSKPHNFTAETKSFRKYLGKFNYAKSKMQFDCDRSLLCSRNAQ
jgi:hypothetical protein